MLRRVAALFRSERQTRLLGVLAAMAEVEPQVREVPEIAISHVEATYPTGELGAVDGRDQVRPAAVESVSPSKLGPAAAEAEGRRTCDSADACEAPALLTDRSRGVTLAREALAAGHLIDPVDLLATLNETRETAGNRPSPHSVTVAASDARVSCADDTADQAIEAAIVHGLPSAVKALMGIEDVWAIVNDALRRLVAAEVVRGCGELDHCFTCRDAEESR